MKPIKTEDVTPQREDKITPMDVYKTLWSCRDFELSHLWQRSVFLTAFLLLVYTGYGALMFFLLTAKSDIPSENLLILSCFGLLILLVGMLLSQLWIMMAKGSKAWYEVYEQAIMEIEGNSSYATDKVVNNMKDDYVKHGFVPNPKTWDYKLYTTLAGGFSLSKINIMIGQLSFGILLVVYLAHTALMALAQSSEPIIVTLASSLALLAVLCLSCCIVKPSVKSTAIGG